MPNDVALSVGLICDTDRVYLNEELPGVPAVGHEINLDSVHYVVTAVVWGYGLDPADPERRRWSPNVYMEPKDPT